MATLHNHTRAVVRGKLDEVPNILAELIAKIGSIAGIILFSLAIRCVVQLAAGKPARYACH
jgi:hypothetical protein